MSDTGTAHSAVVADRADRILEVLRHRDPSEADAQACSMLIAGLRMLDEVRGPDAVAAFLGQAGPIMAGEYPGGPLGAPSADPAPEAAPVTASAEPSYADMVAHDIAYLRGLPLDVAMGRANAAMEAAGAFLHQALEQVIAATDATEASAEPAAPPVTSTPQPQLAQTAQRPDPDAAALALLDGLRALAPGEGHEQARAAIFGASAFLIEQRGPVYTAAVTEGLQVNARRHIEVWGMSPRPDGVSLH